MSHPIQNGPGGPTGPGATGAEVVSHTSELAEAGELRGPSFAEAVARAEEPAAVATAQLDAIVDEVVTELMAGRIGGPAEAFGEVVQRLVDRRFEGLAPEARGRMTEDVREALTSDPYLFLEVEELLGEALERRMGGQG